MYQAFPNLNAGSSPLLARRLIFSLLHPKNAASSSTPKILPTAELAPTVLS
jgi:hypothetical protein